MRWDNPKLNIMKLSLWDQKVSKVTTVIKLVIERFIHGYKYRLLLKNYYFTGKVRRENTFRVRFREEVNGTPLRDLRAELIQMFEEVIRRGSEDYPEDVMAHIYITAENLSNPIIV